MISIRARLVSKIVRRFFNINPKAGEEWSFEKEVITMKNRYKAPKGYKYYSVKLNEEVSLEIVDKLDSNSENLIYILHGGGYQIGLTDIYRNLAKKYSEAAQGARVVFLEYRLLPKHIYPAALEDALLGWKWILDEGYKAKNITVIGDSSGGNLTLAFALKLKERKEELPKSLVLISPWTDMTASGDSYMSKYNVDPIFGKRETATLEKKEEMLSSALFAYAGDVDRKDKFISPIFADYEGFPQTMVLVGTHEILLDDSLVLVDKMKKAKVDTVLYIGDKMFHVWPLFHNLFPEAKKAMVEICEYIKRVYQN